MGRGDAQIVMDTETAPLLVARVSRLSDGGYAHLDIEMRDYDGKTVKTIRSNTVRGAGFTVANLHDAFDTGLLRLTVWLIYRRAKRRGVVRLRLRADNAPGSVHHATKRGREAKKQNKATVARCCAPPISRSSQSIRPTFQPRKGRQMPPVKSKAIALQSACVTHGKRR